MDRIKAGILEPFIDEDSRPAHGIHGSGDERSEGSGASDDGCLSEGRPPSEAVVAASSEHE